MKRAEGILTLNHKSWQLLDHESKIRAMAANVLAREPLKMKYWNPPVTQVSSVQELWAVLQN